jgi:hypothetical protein
MWFGVTLRADTKKTCLIKIIGLCAQNMLQCDINSRLNSQHNWRDLYNHLMSARIFTLITTQDIHMIPLKYEECGYDLRLDMVTISYSLNHVFHKVDGS